MTDPQDPTEPEEIPFSYFDDKSNVAQVIGVYQTQPLNPERLAYDASREIWTNTGSPIRVAYTHSGLSPLYYQDILYNQALVDPIVDRMRMLFTTKNGEVEFLGGLNEFDR